MTTIETRRMLKLLENPSVIFPVLSRQDKRNCSDNVTAKLSGLAIHE